MSLENILEFDATEEEVAAAIRLDTKFSIGSVFWAYNLPIQIWVYKNENDTNGSLGEININDSNILNYMPRKECCEFMTFNELFGGNVPTDDDVKDLTIVTAAVLKNLAHRMIMLGEKKLDYVYYPNEKNEEVNPNETNE